MTILEAIKNRPDDEEIFIGSGSAFFAIEKAGKVREKSYLLSLDEQLHAMVQTDLGRKMNKLRETEEEIEIIRDDIRMIDFPSGKECIQKCGDCSVHCIKYHKDRAIAKVSRELESTSRMKRKEDLHQYMNAVISGGNAYRRIVKETFAYLNAAIQKKESYKEEIKSIRAYMDSMIPIADRQVSYHCRRLQGDGYIVVVEGIEVGRYWSIEEARKYNWLKRSVI